jgi:hypothetical protein
MEALFLIKSNSSSFYGLDQTGITIGTIKARFLKLHPGSDS